MTRQQLAYRACVHLTSTFISRPNNHLSARSRTADCLNSLIWVKRRNRYFTRTPEDRYGNRDHRRKLIERWTREGRFDKLAGVGPENDPVGPPQRGASGYLPGSEHAGSAIEFRRRMTRLTEQRHALPAGSVIAKEYRFKDANGRELGLIDLFGSHDALVTYVWMYGPLRERPCQMCTNWLGAVSGNAADIKQRVALKILGRSPVERQLAFATERGLVQPRFRATVGDNYANDLGRIDAEGWEYPALVVFKRDGEKVRPFWASEMTKGMADPGQDLRNAPDIASRWPILDLTPGGRGTDWYPKRPSGSRQTVICRSPLSPSRCA